MPHSLLLNADSRRIPLADRSVHAVITSPPYFSLRSYEGTAVWEGGDPECPHRVGRFQYKVSEKQKSNAGSAGHLAKAICPHCGAKRIDEQLGIETLHDCGGWVTGQYCGRCYVCNLLAWGQEIYRVLRDDGTFWLNIGDSYNGCVDLETEILTLEGWKTYDHLQEGDVILTLNSTTYEAEWGQLEKVNYFESAKRKMLEIKGRGHASLTTDNHRWYTECRIAGGEGTGQHGIDNPASILTSEAVSEIKQLYATGKKQALLAQMFGVTQTTISKIVTGRAWAQAKNKTFPRSKNGRITRLPQKQTVESCALTLDHKIPIATKCKTPVEAAYSDALVEIVAWYWTEGSDRVSRSGEKAGLIIHQSHMVNPEYVRRIRACLTTFFGSKSDTLTSFSKTPMWAEYVYPSRSDMTEFRLNAHAARVIRECAPDKIVKTQWLAELTQQQLDLFIETSLAADGHGSSLAQRDYRRAEAFQTACILSGKAASITKNNMGMFCVEIRKNQWTYPLKHPHKWIEYTGAVWCPTTNNGTWLARKDGQVFFTGNSGGAGGDYAAGWLKEGQPKFKGARVEGLKPKDLMGIPWRSALALQAQGWYLRNDLPWFKRNCLAQSTLLYAQTARKTTVSSLKDLARLKPETVKLWNGEKWTQVLEWLPSQAQAGLEIELRSGEKIKCTLDHLWPTARGLLAAQDLRVGDCLTQAHLPNSEGELSHLPSEIGWLVGLYLAEGSRSGEIIQFAGHTRETQERLERINKIVNAYGARPYTFYRGGNSETINLRNEVVSAILNTYIGGKGARGKHLTSACWTRENAFLENVLEGYLAGDGHWDRGNQRWRLLFTKNDALASNLRTIAARLGYDLRLKLGRTPYNGQDVAVYRGEIKTKPRSRLSKDSLEIVALTKNTGLHYIDVVVEDDPHVFALASGVLTHNCMPQSATDRLSMSHEHVFLFSKSADYYFDMDAVRVPYTKPMNRWGGEKLLDQGGDTWGKGTGQAAYRDRDMRPNAEGRHWRTNDFFFESLRAILDDNKQTLLVDSSDEPLAFTVNTSSYKGAHFATWNPKLVEPMIRAATSEMGVCGVCGTPWIRGTEAWSPACTCGDLDAKPALILEPFSGSGTTIMVAKALGRNGIGLDLSFAYTREQGLARTQNVQEKLF